MGLGADAPSGDPGRVNRTIDSAAGPIVAGGLRTWRSGRVGVDQLVTTGVVRAG